MAARGPADHNLSKLDGLKCDTDEPDVTGIKFHQGYYSSGSAEPFLDIIFPESIFPQTFP